MTLFKLKENKTSVKTEIIAGVTTFLTMIYIVPVNASIMSETGMPFEALVIATALVTMLASAFNGLFANTPIAMSVGMGMNVYFTFSICVDQKIPWQSALGVVFLSGLIFLILSFTNFRLWVMRNIPKDLRLAICGGLGCFIAFLGLQKMGVIVKNESVFVGIGDFKNPNVLFGIFTLILIIFFWTIKVKGAFIIAVLISSAIAWIFGINGASFPKEFVSLPNFDDKSGFGAIFLKLDILSALNLAMIPAILTLFITQLFDTIGTVTGLGVSGKLFDEPKEGEKKLGKTLIADAASSGFCSFFGTSTVTAFVESSTGIESGGRTGLTAVVTALCFALTLFLLPFFKAIPNNAINPILVVVGILMFVEIRNIDFKDSAIAVASFFIILMMPFTFHISSGFAFGFIAYLLVRVFKKEWDKINLGILILSLICLLNFVLIALYQGN